MSEKIDKHCKPQISDVPTWTQIDAIEALHQKYDYIVYKEFKEAYQNQLERSVFRELESLLCYAKKNFMCELEWNIFGLKEDNKKV